MTVEPWAQVTFQWGQTHRSLAGDPLVGVRTLWNRAINVGTGISGSSDFSTYRQTLDPIVKPSLTDNTGTQKAHNVEDLRAIAISTRTILDFSLFSGTTVEVSKNQLFQGVSKGTHPCHPSILLFEYLLDVSLHFWSFVSQHFKSIFK